MASIFISYRRDDSAGHTGRLYDRLTDHFGPDQVFMDVDTIKPGRDFIDAVREAVSRCDGLVAIIGQDWLTSSDASGARRLDNPDDLVKQEIAFALELGIRVVPVLVQGAQMPDAGELPEAIKDLARRNAQEISDRSFRSDAQLLIEALEAPDPEPSEGAAFIGREGEFVEFRTALDGALAGHGRLAMLSGEPGIGKTRMAQELASHAERQGAQVLWGWCYEQAGAPPYWPWVDSVRSYISLMDPEQLRSLMGPGAADICEVILELKDKLPGLEPLPVLDPDQARFRLFDSFANFFINASQVQPLLLVLDDLQWADKPSLLLLEFLTRRLADSRLMVLGTYRDADVTPGTPLFESLAQLRRSPMFLSRVLEGLESGQVGSFIREAGGGEASQELIDAIYRHTEGNPFFIAEVIRLLVERGELEEVSGRTGSVTLGIPQGVLEVVSQRLNRLSTECNDVLTTIAVAGRQFDFKLLELLNEQTPSIQLVDLMDEAQEARVIIEVTGQKDRYQFIHALMHQTLQERLSTGRKVRAHARIGEGLETLYGDRLAEHAAELAYHFSEASVAVGPEKLVRYSLLSGEQALAGYGWEEAQAHFQRGLAAHEGRPLDDQTAALHFGLGRAQGSTGQHHDAWATMTRAFDYYVDSGDVSKAVAVAEYPLLFVAGLAGATEMVDRALSLVEPDSHEAGRLLSRCGLLVNLEKGDYSLAKEFFDRALIIAEREKDQILEMRTLAASADADWYQIRAEDTLAKSLRVIELAQLANDPHTEAWPRFLAAIVSIGTGNPDAAMDHASEMLGLAERLRDTGLLTLACCVNCALSLRKGDWISARDFADRGLAVDSRFSWILALRVEAEHQVGDASKADVYMDQLVDVMRTTPPGPNVEYQTPAWVIPVAARITGEDSKFDIAEQAAQAVLSSPYCTPRLALLRFGQAMIPVQRNDAALADQHYADLLALREEIPEGEPLVVCGPCVSRVLGLLAHTIGNLDRATEHFDDALAFCRNAGYRPELAWTCCDYADTLRNRDSDGDRAKAISLLEESLAIASELGMRPLMERVQSRQESLKA